MSAEYNNKSLGHVHVCRCESIIPLDSFSVWFLSYIPVGTIVIFPWQNWFFCCCLLVCLLQKVGITVIPIGALSYQHRRFLWQPVLPWLEISFSKKFKFTCKTFIYSNHLKWESSDVPLSVHCINFSIWTVASIIINREETSTFNTPFI